MCMCVHAHALLHAERVCTYLSIYLFAALFLLLVAFTITTTIGFIDERIARFHDHPILWLALTPTICIYVYIFK